MTSTQIGMTTIVAIYLVVCLVVGTYVGRSRKQQKTTGTFLRDYFMGSRSMGGFVLAMTLVITYTSAGSFLGGPGLSVTRGLTQTFIAVAQVGTAFICLGIIGKKFGLISRKINAVSVSDFLRARYKSEAVIAISSIAMIAFFVTQGTAQFIGGGVLFETITGLSYTTGLIIFGAVVIIYSTFGGFKGVVITDVIQGIVMVTGSFMIIIFALNASGGLVNITDWFNANVPYWYIPGQRGTFGPIDRPGFIITQSWVLVGIATLGLPQNTVRSMGFKSTHDLHKAMLYGTFVVGILMVGMHFGGFLLAPTIPAGHGMTTDHFVPFFASNHMPAGLAGLMLAAPLAAIMSTVSSLMILAAANVIKDLYLNYLAPKDVDKNSDGFRKSVSRASMIVTCLLGIAMLIISLNPPDVIVWINLFALGGLQATFFWPTLLGLYWPKASTKGCLASMVVGIAVFIFFNRNPALRPFGLHEITVGLAAGGLAFWLVSKFANEQLDKATKYVFYGIKE